MKKIAIIIISLSLFLTNGFAADINTGQTIRGTVNIGDTPATNGVGNYVYRDGVWQKMTVSLDGYTLVQEQGSKNPLSGTTYLYYETTGTVTNTKITPTMPAGTNVWISAIDVHSLDTTNKGLVRFYFASSGGELFYTGYLGTAPSAFGTNLYTSGTNAGIWATTPGACAIVIHYKTGTVGP